MQFPSHPSGVLLCNCPLSAGATSPPEGTTAWRDHMDAVPCRRRPASVGKPCHSCCFSFCSGLKNVKLTFATGGGRGLHAAASPRRDGKRSSSFSLFIYLRQRRWQRGRDRCKKLQNTDAAAAAASGLLRWIIMLACRRLRTVPPHHAACQVCHLHNPLFAPRINYSPGGIQASLWMASTSSELIWSVRHVDVIIIKLLFTIIHSH